MRSKKLLILSFPIFMLLLATQAFAELACADGDESAKSAGSITATEKSVFTRSIVQFVNSSNPTQINRYEDYCTSSSTLTEYFCTTSKTVGYKNLTCTKGCLNGGCKK